MEFDPEMPHYTTTMNVNDTAHIRIGSAEVVLKYLFINDDPAIEVTAQAVSNPNIKLGYFRIYLNPIKPEERKPND